MDIIEERTKTPTHLTYRAVGSSTGQKEFLGASNGNVALNHFGSGDIPMTASRYAAVTGAGRSMVHIPFALGAIGVFHSVATAGLPSAGLHLDGCVLAKIFSAQITTWDHAEIVALNPGMTATGAIKVVHRTHGSSSTAGFTEYLQQKCSASWTLGTGSTLTTWPDSTFEAQGSGGMSAYISSNENAIGYIDAGHGHAARLGEVALQNADGVYLRTNEADIGAAGTTGLANSVIPSDPSADFSAVNLYDLAGPTTWPITMISYFYVNKDLSTMDAGAAALLVAFITFIMSAEGQTMAEANLFSRLPAELIAYNQATLASLTLPTGYTPYAIELASTTQVEVGAGAMVISGKRRSYAEYERTQLTAQNTALLATVASLRSRIVALEGSNRVRSSFTAAGDIADFDDSRRAAIAAIIAARAGVSVSEVSVTVEPGSVNVVIDILVADQSAAASTASDLSTTLFADSTTLASALQSGGVDVSVAAVEAPAAQTVAPTRATGNAKSNTHDLAVVGVALGAAALVVALLCLLAIVLKGGAAGKPVQREVSFPTQPKIKETTTTSTGKAAEIQVAVRTGEERA